eukprot:CAMPEP_0194142890 /NCGR_PEP_ID=MMETSP0152-20130528/12103_1 /TAXON_ID=1049557 /ORGANISM="Thalassiothrix antarctica, Strain L6-D1" /LENGTH=148 /DNA_ID=CAMNT_0038842035 /DNA_START=146 /DNA_END=589 /DNA_ORIENTATION=+
MPPPLTETTLSSTKPTGIPVDCGQDPVLPIPNQSPFPPSKFSREGSNPLTTLIPTPSKSCLATIGSNIAVSGVTGAVDTGAFVTGAFVTGAFVIGAFVIGASDTGAFVIGASDTGAFVIGASVTGAALTGATLIGAREIGAGEPSCAS